VGVEAMMRGLGQSDVIGLENYTFNPSATQMYSTDSLLQSSPTDITTALSASTLSQADLNVLNSPLTGGLSSEVNPDLTDVDWSFTGSAIPGLPNYILYSLAAIAVFAFVGGRQ
jgi:hypothetical protein